MQRYDGVTNSGKATPGELHPGLVLEQRVSRRQQQKVGSQSSEVLCAAHKQRFPASWKPVNNGRNRSSSFCRRKREIQQLPNKQTAGRTDGQMNGRIDIRILLDPSRIMCHVFEGRGSHFCKTFFCQAVCCSPSKQAVFPSLPLMCCFKMRFRSTSQSFCVNPIRPKEASQHPKSQRIACHICPQRLFSASDSRGANYTAQTRPSSSVPT